MKGFWFIFQQGVINIDNDMLFIEPLLNDSFVDKALLNKTGRPHLIYKHSHLSKNNMGLDALDFSTRIGKPSLAVLYEKLEIMMLLTTPFKLIFRTS